MSDRMTSCEPVDRSTGVAGIAEWGRVDRPTMVAAFRSYYERQLAESQAALALSDDELVVTTYLGPLAMRKREVVS